MKNDILTILSEGSSQKNFWQFLSVLGDFPAAIVFIIGGYLIDLQLGHQLLLSLIGITLACQIFKGFYFKPRPDNPEGIRPPSPFKEKGITVLFSQQGRKELDKWADYSSFPSIHSARSFAAAIIIASYFEHGTIYPLLFLAVIIGYSRIVNKRHFLIDIVTGGIIGGIVGSIIFCNFTSKYFQLTRPLR